MTGRSSSKRRSPLLERGAVISCTQRTPLPVRCLSAAFRFVQTFTPKVSLADRRPALLSILKSMVVTYSSFLGALLAPPPSTASSAPPEWQRQVNWITVLAQNVMAAANDLRPVQVCRCPKRVCLRAVDVDGLQRRA